MLASLQEINEAQPDDEGATPLVLIHDGGGTIFQYYMLGYLGRTVYGIASPYYEHGTKPDGGITELANIYLEAIAKTIPQGSIILGGWSFGGVISIEIARLLAHSDSKLRIAGIIMLDSPCPWAIADWKSKRPTPHFLPTTSERTKYLITTSFVHCRTMLSTYQKPTEWRPPPTAMIRAEESSISNGNHDVEDDGVLGWTVYEDLQISPVETVPGDHYSMFAEDKIDAITAKINQVLKAFLQN